MPVDKDSQRQDNPYSISDEVRNAELPQSSFTRYMPMSIGLLCLNAVVALPTVVLGDPYTGWGIQTLIGLGIYVGTIPFTCLVIAILFPSNRNKRSIWKTIFWSSVFTFFVLFSELTSFAAK